MMRITKTISFDAAHYLDGCAEPRPYGRVHGHSFILEATLEGEPDRKTGWVADFADLAAAMDALKATLDHQLLNEVEGLGRPTLENICSYAAQRLGVRFATLKQVRVSRPSIGESCALDV
jgi:6-pyruvoyltetrahydropterin/6-carboxytetrahydropterin synthase